jgi:hypothetical protein
MTWRPAPDRDEILTELDREELLELNRQRERQPRASRTPHTRDTKAACSWEPTEVDREAGREW